MRHIPTTIYIDSEFLNRINHRFDNKACVELKATFVKGGLRLLVPVIMERELQRHLNQKAEKVVDAIIKAHEQDHVNHLSLVKLPSRDVLLAKCIEGMLRQWESFRDHFVVESLPIVGDLERVVNWYFDAVPPFSEKKKEEFPDAFIISALDQHHEKHQANIAVIGNDPDFIRTCALRRYFKHFSGLKEFIEAFKPELSAENLLPSEIDSTKPIASEDLKELKVILKRGAEATPHEIDRVIKLLKPRGTNYDFFFKNAKDLVWLKPLSDNGFFLNPPNLERTKDGQILMPWWEPIEYLARVFDSSRNEVLTEISKLPNTDNSRVLDGIMRIVLKADSPEAIHKFSHFIFSFIKNCRWGHELIIEMLKKPYFFDSKLSEVTPGILFKLVEFRPDPHEADKVFQREENPEAWNTSLEPVPPFDQWMYKEILEKGVRPLAERDPFQVARTLIDAVASMIRIGIHKRDLEKMGDEDFSDIWCRRLENLDGDFSNPKAVLVQTLAHACKLVFKNAPESQGALDQALRNPKWKVFKRLRQLLYATFPTDQTLPWIRKLILEHGDYFNCEHHYEFQLMIRRASEHFGRRLLSPSERTTIFESILSGPSKEDFRKWIGEDFIEEDFQQRQSYFHHVQLRPFAPLLTGEFQQYFDKLEREQSKEITDDTYPPFGVKGGTVTCRSPKPAGELEQLSDEELLSFLNNWDEEQRDKENWLVEINFSALASEFQRLFKEKIVPDRERLSFWKTNKEKIKRPIYVAAMVKAMMDIVKSQDISNLDQWFEFCNWVLSHPEVKRIEGEPIPQPESCDYPDWSSSRRAVVDFVESCLDKTLEIPIVFREDFANLLQQACNQFDWRLDQDSPVFLNREDQATEAINNTRSRALDALIGFGFWIRGHASEEEVSEVTNILSKRLKNLSEFPMTRPEQALLGRHFQNLYVLNQDWTSKNRETLIPQGDVTLWQDAFGNYLRFNRPNKVIFDLLQGDFELALKNLKSILAQEGKVDPMVDRLGQHIFTYYLWGVFPLKGETSLLELFFQETSEKKELWASLFDHVGRSLKNSDKELAQELTDRAKAFFDWRLEVAEPQELKEFAFWLEADCLEPGWRLSSFSKVLDLGFGKNTDLYMEMKTLNKFVQDNLALVIECFKKITDVIAKDRIVFVSTEDAIPILKAGLGAEDQQIRVNAETARENLLRDGRFDFLEID